MPTPPQRPLPRPAKNPAAPLPHLFPLEGMTPGLPHEPLPHLAMAPVPALPSTNFSSEDFEPLECSWTFDEASRYTLRSGRCPTRTLLPCCPPHCSTHLIVLCIYVCMYVCMYACMYACTCRSYLFKLPTHIHT